MSHADDLKKKKKKKKDANPWSRHKQSNQFLIGETIFCSGLLSFAC